VVIDLLVRRFFRDRADCARKTFAEQDDELTVQYARHTVAAQHVLASVALAVGGRTGQRLSERLSVSAGRMTLLRLIRRLPDPVTTTPRVFGVDDFALRRGTSNVTSRGPNETYAPLASRPLARRPRR
jgi:hypothetical protein